MSKEISFAVLGGDLRQTWLVRFLREKGHTVSAFSVPQIPDSGQTLRACLQEQEAVILPLPSFRSGLLNTAGALSLTAQQLLDALPQPTAVFGARLGQLEPLFREKGHTVIDYSAMEQMAVANAVPTAEGAIQLAMEHLPITLHRSRCLVIGFGRIGKLLAIRLQALGAHVTVSARRPAHWAMIEALSCDWEETGVYRNGLSQYDLVVNTVPAPVLTKQQLAQLGSQCLLLELASTPPGGFDMAACRDLGLTAILGAQLPGKAAPKTAGAIIGQTILDCFTSDSERVSVCKN